MTGRGGYGFDGRRMSENARRLRSPRRTRRERQMGFVVSQGDVAAINDEVRNAVRPGINGEAE